MTTRWLRLLLIALLLAPTAALPAGAQVPPAPPAPGVPPPPVPPPAVPGVPPPPAPPPTVVVPPPAPPPPGLVPSPAFPPTLIETGPVPYQVIEVTPAHRVGAVALNIVHVPGKAITCAAGLGTAALLMLATLGSQYPWAVRLTEEGCGYPWVLTPEHVAGKDPRDEER